MLQEKINGFADQAELGVQPRTEAQSENMTDLQAGRQSRTDTYQRPVNVGSSPGSTVAKRKGRTGLSY
jgi:hypothetical protein